MLSKGIKELREKKIIDDRLYDWSQHLQAFRNLAAHPDEDFTASRQDVEDLQAFVQAIVEYVYDLADRYAEFKARVARQEKRKRPPEAQEEMDEP
jgi:regulator of sigma D